MRPVDGSSVRIDCAVRHVGTGAARRQQHPGGGAPCSGAAAVRPYEAAVPRAAGRVCCTSCSARRRHGVLLGVLLLPPAARPGPAVQQQRRRLLLHRDDAVRGEVQSGKRQPDLQQSRAVAVHEHAHAPSRRRPETGLPPAVRLLLMHCRVQQEHCFRRRSAAPGLLLCCCLQCRCSPARPRAVQEQLLLVQWSSARRAASSTVQCAAYCSVQRAGRRCAVHAVRRGLRAAKSIHRPTGLASLEISVRFPRAAPCAWEAR